MSIKCCFMRVFIAFILIEIIIFSVKLPADVIFKLIFVVASRIHKVERSSIENFRTVAQILSVVGKGKSHIPLMSKLDKGFGKWSNKLIIDID